MSEEKDNTDLQAQIDALNEKLAKAEKAKKDALGEKFKLANDLDEERTAREQEREEAERAAGDIAALEKRLTEKWEKQLKAEQDKNATLDTELRTIRIDNEISKALDEGNVLPHMKPVLASHYKLMAKYEDGQGNIEGNPIADYIKTHLASDEGANYRKASENTGGNANDSTKTVTMQKLSKRPETQAEWDYLDSLPDAERNALCDAIGEPSLKV